jgi:hypothetical protein
VQEILIVGSELVTEHCVEMLDDDGIALHEILPERCGEDGGEARLETQREFPFAANGEFDQAAARQHLRERSVSMISRAVSSQVPQHVATGNWRCTAGSESAPRWTLSRICRSVTALHRQTYMGNGYLDDWPPYKRKCERLSIKHNSVHAAAETLKPEVVAARSGRASSAA